jgi:uncharacterized protein (TIGR03000 family)
MTRFARLAPSAGLVLLLALGRAAAQPPPVMPGRSFLPPPGSYLPYNPYYPPRAYFLYSPPPNAPTYDSSLPWGGFYSRPDTRYRAFPLFADEKTPAAAPARVEVRVPPAADVWFGSVRTKQTGAARLFESPELTPGKQYAYEVRARWREGGNEVERTRRIIVSAGARAVVDFTTE